MAGRMEGKNILVTGAGSIGPGWGNGKAAACLYAREGARVLGCDIHADALSETRKIIEDEGQEFHAVTADISDPESVEGLVSEAVRTLGHIDVIHSNVGIVKVGGPIETDIADWDRILDVNVRSLFLLCKYALPAMIARGGGSIIAISSIAGHCYLGYPSAAYNASKGAIQQLVQNIALQHAADGIRANCVCPGLMDTPQIRAYVTSGYGGDVEKMIETRNKSCPSGKMGTAWDVAHASLFLASDEARYITGQCLIVDGGITGRIA